MVSTNLIVLYHGTDIDSALDILNNGLDTQRLLTLQSDRVTQLGIGWYATDEPETAWFFASLAPGNTGHGYTVIEMELSKYELELLIQRGLAVRREIVNVPFLAEQYWFALDIFELLNERAIFRPYQKQEKPDAH